MTLKEYLEARLKESKKDNYAFTHEDVTFLAGSESELESLLDEWAADAVKIRDAK
jgi:hypothetical protein